ncbi:MAG: beta strand repeat-containing protein, partial [Mycobacterium sp.]
VNDSSSPIDLTVSGIVSGATGTGLIKTGSGVLSLTGANTYDGPTTISQSTLVISSLGDVNGGASPLGLPTTIANGTISLSNGTLQYTGSGHTSDRVLALPTSGTLDASGTGPLKFTSNLQAPGANIKTFTLTGTSASLNEIAGIIPDNSVSNITNISKTGTGTWALTGANTYTGVTTVGSGTLVINSIANVNGGASSVGAPTTVGNGTIALGINAPSTLRYVGAGSTTDRVINLAGSFGVTLDASGSGALVFTSPLSATGSSSKTLTFTGTSTATNQFQGTIPNTSGGFPIGVLKSGAGTWKFSGTNTYTGGTTVSNGTLLVGSAGALSSGSTLNVLSDTAGGTALVDMSGFSNTVAALNIGGATGADATSTANIAATGGGTLTLNGNVAYLATGNPLGSTIAANLNLNGGGRSFTINDSATAATDLTISGIISNGSITKTGAGTLLLTGANTYTGATTVLDGRLVLGSDAALPTAAVLTVTSSVAGGTAILDLNGQTTTLSGFNGTSITIGGATGANSSSSASITGTGTLTIGANIVYQNTGNPLGSSIASNLDLGNAGRTITTNDSTATATELTISGAISNGTLTKNGAGTLLLSGTNTYTGVTTVNDGALKIGSNGALPSTTTLNLVSTITSGIVTLDIGTFSPTVAALNLNGAGSASTANIVGTGTLNLGGTFTYSGNLAPLATTISANLGLGNAARTFAINDSTAAAIDVTISGNIGETAISGINKTGSGTLLLSGTNTYTGVTTLSSGTVIAGSDAAFGGSTLAFTGGTLQGTGVTRTFSNPLSFGAGTVTLGGSTNLVFNGNITNTFNSNVTLLVTNSGTTTFNGDIPISNNASSFSLTISNTGTVTLEGAISNGPNGSTASALAKLGAGVLELGGANTYGGNTTISDGTIRLLPGGTLPATGLTVTSTVPAGTATLDLNGQDTTVTFVTLGGTPTSNTLSGGDILGTGGGTLTIGGTLTYQNNNNPRGSLISANLNLGDVPRTFTINDSTSTSTELTISGDISQNNTTGLTKNGTGTLLLSGTNTYSGGTTVSDGRLVLGSDAALPFDDLNVFAGSATTAIVDLNGHDITVPNLTLGGSATTSGSSLLATGGGTVSVIGGSITYNATNNPLGAAISSNVNIGSGGSRIIFVNDSTTAPDDLTISGNIVESAATALTKNGAGVLSLTGTNTYTGVTTVLSGTLAITSPSSISNALLNLNGGVLATAGTFNRDFGTTAGTFNIRSGGGGFAAYGGPLTVSIPTVNPTWGTTSGFLSSGGNLILGSTGANDALTWTSDFSLGAASRTIVVNDNTFTAADIATISSVISGTGSAGLTKSGAGTLILSGTNTYPGPTTIAGGTLIPGGSNVLPSAGSNLILNGGVLATTSVSTLVPALGTGPGQTSFGTNGGGYAAYGGPLTVSVGTNPTWASTSSFLPLNAPLILSSVNATDVVTWSSDFSLGAATRVINVNDNVSTAADGAVISGIISGALNSGITKRSPGPLSLTGVNTFNGPVTIEEGTLIVDTINSVNGATGPLGVPTTAANGTLAFGTTTTAGTLRYTGSSNITTDRVLSLVGSGGIDSSGTGSLKFTSAPTASGNTKTLTLTGTSTGANEIAGSIPNTGATSLIKSGSGKWLLSGTNTYTGATTVGNGTLVLGSNGALPSSTTLNLLSDTAGGTAIVDVGSAAATVTNINIGGTTGADATSATNLIASGAGTLTVNGSISYKNTGNPLGSTISSPLALTATTHTVDVADSPTAAEDLVISGNIGLAVAAGITKTGTGVLKLSGTNAFTGTSTISGGTVVIGSNSAFGTAGTLNLGGTNPTTATLQGDGTPRTIANPTNLTTGFTIGGASDLTFTGQMTNTTGNLTTLNIPNSGTTTLGGISLANSVFAQPVTLNATGGLVIVSGVIANGGGASSGFLAKAGAGIVELRGANTYSSSTTVSQGILRLGTGGSLPANATLNVISTLPGETPVFDVNGQSSQVGSITIGGNTGVSATSGANILATTGGTLTLNGNITYQATGNPLGSTIAANLNIGSSARTFTVNDSTTAANDLTISGIISGTGGSITKSGTGTLVLSGASTYTGVTTLSSGTTIVAGDNLSGVSGPLGTGTITFANGILAGDGTTRTLANPVSEIGSSGIGGAGGLVFTGAFTHAVSNTLSITNTGATTFSGPFALSSNVASNTVTVNATGGLVTINGAVTNGTGGSTASAFQKSGTGILELGGVNTYGGSTTVFDGTLRLGAGGTLPVTNLLVTTNISGGTATLNLNGRDVSTNGLFVGGTGAASSTSTANIVGGGGTITLTGNAIYQNTGNPLGSTISANINLGSNATRTFTVNDSTATDAELTVSGNIVETTSSGISKNGAGTLILSGTNTYTGPTTVSQGILRLGSNTGLSPASALNLIPGSTGFTTTLDLGGFNGTAAGIVMGGGNSTTNVSNIIAVGGGTLTLAGNLTYLSTGNPLGSTISANLNLGS